MLSKISVKKPFTVFVCAIIIIILGVISFTSMTTDLLPNMEFPYAIISTTYIGASPEKVETVVTKPLEQSMATVENVKNISSISNENSSIVMLEFNSDVNMDSALIDINSKLDLVKAAWTDNTIGSPMVMKINPNMLPVMITALDIESVDDIEITNFVNNNILPKLERIEGVASVSASGLIEENLDIKLNQSKIDKLNEKILASIDEKLSETENSLNTAKASLNSGKSALQTQSDTQMSKIIDGINAINDGKNKIEEASSDLKDKETMLLISKELLQTTLNGIDLSYEKLEKEKQDIINSGIESEENTKKLEAIEISMSALNKTKDSTQDKLNETNLGLLTISNAKEQLELQKVNLDSQNKSLELAKVTLSNELSKASALLSANEEKLNQATQEFEKAREEAYKNASLEGVITQSMISNILTADNFSMPAGYIRNDGNDIIVKVGEKFSSIEEIKNLTLFSFDFEGLENVTLSDVADIGINNNSDEIYARVNQNKGVILTFQKQSTASTATVAKDIQKELENLKSENSNLRTTILMDQGKYINIIIESVLQNLLYGGILAIVILLLFLKDYRPTIIIGLSIPLSLVFAITLMYFTGVTINIISLSGLALGVGMLVDNSIVVIENIYRLKGEGKSNIQAAIEGASSVAGAIFASTLTTVCVFLPIVFIQGISRQLFADMGLTIAYSLVASLIVALTLVPAMASGMLKKKTKTESKLFEKILGVYHKALNWSLNHRAIVLSIVVILFVFSVFLATRMGTAFIPSVDSTQISLTMTMPKDATNTELKDTSNEIINRLLTIDDIDVIGAVDSNLSSSMMSSTSSKSVSMYIILNDDKKLDNVQIKEKILDITKDLNCEIEVSTSNMDLSALGGSGITLAIKGEDTQKLQEIAQDVSKLLENVEGISKIDDGNEELSKEMRIVIDKNKAMEYGLTVAQVYSTVSDSLKNELESTKITLENIEYPVVVTKENSINSDNLMQIEIKGTKNQEEVTLKLADIASLAQTDTLKAINHDNSTRYINVTAEIDSEHNIGLVSRDVEEILKEYVVEDGYTVELNGENETINQSLQDLAKMIALAIVFIYLIMVSQFQSLKSPFIIMFTIPLAFTGGLLAMAITNTEISLIAMLGFLVLSGVVVNNGIVFVDYVNQLKADGMETKEALLLAGKTRLKPILMTALTTILGLLTMSLGIGEGAEMTQPLGIVTVGGLLYATILTLFVVPCIYSLMFRKKQL